VYHACIPLLKVLKSKHGVIAAMTAGLLSIPAVLECMHDTLDTCKPPLQFDTQHLVHSCFVCDLATHPCVKLRPQHAHNCWQALPSGGHRTVQLRGVLPTTLNTCWVISRMLEHACLTTSWSLRFDIEQVNIEWVLHTKVGYSVNSSHARAISPPILVQALWPSKAEG